MKKRNEIDVDQVLTDYLATVSTEQLIAELETPHRAVLMTIPDEDFFQIPFGCTRHADGGANGIAFDKPANDLSALRS